MNRVRAWLELVRAPNLFTAAADSLAGYWLCSATIDFPWQAGLMIATSVCLYAGGIVLNDLRDIETDRRERPARPLPSGRILVVSASVLYVASLGIALIASVGAGLVPDGSDVITIRATGFVVACAIAVVVALYDCVLKETAFGPVAMGACRALNVLLGMSVAGPLNWDIRMAAPLAMFVYVASFTAFGRKEVGISSRTRLTGGGIGVLLSIIILGVLAAKSLADDPATLVLWFALAIHLGRVTLRAVRHPQPLQVGYAMKTFILAVIAFDAVIASAAHGWPAAAVVMMLLVPAIVIGRWVYST
ncbi:MAG: UbiA family prenyltransferase [Planctomycetes bacterium]|nr:UbiA family prenyltransferase [Planctomycetota bacterium]